MTAPMMASHGFDVTEHGGLVFTWGSLRAALDARAVDLSKSAPEGLASQAKAAEQAGDLLGAALLYLGASVVSAGLSRTMMYEQEAATLVRRHRAGGAA